MELSKNLTTDTTNMGLEAKAWYAMKHHVIMQEMKMATMEAVHTLVPHDPTTTLELGVSYHGGANADGHGGAIAVNLHLIAGLGWRVLIVDFGWPSLGVSNFEGF
jgi:hypothetical protein